MNPLRCLVLLALLPTVVQAEPRFVAQWGQQGSEPGQFHFPIGIAISPTDEIYVTDHYNNRVQKFDTSGKLLAFFPVLPYPGGITIGPTGDLYISHFPASGRSKDKYHDRIS